MSRIVRQSSYRHVFGTPSKKTYDQIKISGESSPLPGHYREITCADASSPSAASAWDTNLVSVSGTYVAVNYQSSGGGAFLVTPLDQPGKLPDQFPLCRAHTAPVLDTAWSPFDDALIASAGEDGRVAITRVDDTVLTEAWAGDAGGEVRDLEPMHKFAGHGRKAGHVKWHPTADGILASASTEVKIWDVGAQQCAYTSEVHSDMVQSISWDYCGTVYATTCKDKKLRLFDPRAGSSAVTVADSHSGIKGSRVEWMGSMDRIVTTGFSKMSERQVYMWDSRDLVKGPIKTLSIDQSSGTLMPFWNAGNNMLFLAGKGDGNIRYYEYENDDLFYLSEYSSPTAQRGMCLLPSRALNVSENEIARAFKCVGAMVQPISFVVPRKSDAFQSDLYPNALSEHCALSSSEWLSGKNAQPILVDMETHQQSTSTVTSTPVRSYAPPTVVSTPPTPTASARAPEPQATPVRHEVVSRTPTPPTPAAVVVPAPVAVAAPAPVAATNGAAHDQEIKELRAENAKLKLEVAERDTLVRELELKLEKVKSAFA